MKRNTVLLESLITSYSTSGYEDNVVSVVKQELMSVPGAKIEFQDCMKNIAISKGTGKTKVLISGHSDWIAFQVFGITENGFLRIKSIGGSDRRTLPGSEVVVITEQGKEVPGIVGIKPIHVTDYDKISDVGNYEDLLVDVGAETKADVGELGIELGNPIYHKAKSLVKFGESGNRVCGTALDDRVGLYIVAEVFKRTDNPNITLVAAAFSQEEVGLRGAGNGAVKVGADISIDLDVCPSTEPETGIDKNKYGDTELGKGPVISYGVTCDTSLCRELKKVARDNRIPFQIEVSSAGGTNTWEIQIGSRDCMTALVSIPNRNMHTQVEMCDWRDIEGAIELLCNYLEGLD